MSAWLGGLAFLLAAVPAATRALAPPERTRLLAAALRRFSSLALLSVLALAATGTLQAIFEVRTPSALFDTAFGRAVLVKAALLLALIALGALNRRRVVPALEAPGRRRRRARGRRPAAAAHAARRSRPDRRRARGHRRAHRLPAAHRGGHRAGVDRASASARSTST